MISIMFHGKYLIRKRAIFQKATCFIVVFLNLILSLPVILINETLTNQDKNYNGSNQTLVKCLTNNSSVFWLDFIQKDILPFVLMFTISSLTVRFILKSRMPRNNKDITISSKRKRDTKYAIVSTGLNILYLLLNLPYCILNLMTDYLSNNNSNSFRVVNNLFLCFAYMNAISVFFVNFKFNYIFKNEFYRLFSIDK